MMIRRAGFVLGVVFVSQLAHAASGVWRGSVHGPHGLPDIDIDLGYESGYVPTENMPVAIHARASAQPFDGYIGYFLTAERRPLNIPVFSRAHMPASSTWSFHTFERTHHEGPTPQWDVVVEWRDRSMQPIASRRAGLPSWCAMRPMRMVGASEPATDRTMDGNGDV